MGRLIGGGARGGHFLPLVLLAAVVTLTGCETAPPRSERLGGADQAAQFGQGGVDQKPTGEDALATVGPEGAGSLAQASAEERPGTGFLAVLFGGGGQQGDGAPDRAERDAARADDCLRQAIELPYDTSFRDANMRRLLGCAERNYRKALRLSAAESGTSRRVAYHGGLLLTLSERRNRLDDNTRQPRIGRENEKLLKAADAARDEAPENVLGFLYGASARLFRATLTEDDKRRCEDLREAASMLSASPPPPDTLREEQERLAELAALEVGRCASPTPSPTQVATRGAQSGPVTGDGDIITQSN